jgi:hypothetical protein
VEPRHPSVSWQKKRGRYYKEAKDERVGEITTHEANYYNENASIDLPSEPPWLPSSTTIPATLLMLLSDDLSGLLLPTYLLSFILFVAPGLALVLLVPRSIDRSFALPVALATSSLFGYIAFWLYFLDADVGRRFSWVISIGGLLACMMALSIRRCSRELLQCVDVAVPIALMLCLGLFYLSLLYAVHLDNPEIQPRYRFLPGALPGDNEIPFDFAERLYRGLDPRMPHGEWQSSDRPPLQTGIFLLQRPVGTLLGGSAAVQYQLLACALQCSWVPAIWMLLRTARMSVRRTARVVAFLMFSGFIMVNCVYVWPKMLSAALAIFGLGSAVRARVNGRRASLIEISFLAIASALAFLAHGGAGFTLIALAFLLLLPGYWPGLGRAIAGGVAFVVTVSPWIAYQRIYEPPGDRLIKMHLAGITIIDRRPTWQALLDAYRNISPSEALANRLANLKSILGPPVNLEGGLEAFCNRTRLNEFYHLVYALGLLNLGWGPLLVHLSTKHRNQASSSETVLRVLVGFSLLNLAIWLALMFSPSSTVLHQGPYAAYLLLFASLAAGLTWLPTWSARGILFLFVGWFFFVWIFINPNLAAGRPILTTIILAITSLALLIVILTKAGTRPIESGPVLLGHDLSIVNLPARK